MQADSVGAKTEIDNLKIQLRKLQEKLSEVISRVSSLEGDLVPSHVDGLTEDQCHDHVNTSDALKSSGKSFELSVSSSTAQRNLNGDRHLVGTAYCSRLVTLPREYEHQNLLHDLSLRPENGCLVVEKSEPSTLTSKLCFTLLSFLVSESIAYIQKPFPIYKLSLATDESNKLKGLYAVDNEREVVYVIGSASVILPVLHAAIIGVLYTSVPYKFCGSFTLLIREAV